MNAGIDLRSVRRAYAKQILFAAGISDARIEEAFAEVAREHFLPPGPWSVVRLGIGVASTPSADPVYVYSDSLIALIPDRHINNGQPSLHAALLALVSVREGDHVVHVGAGLGYYTAILAHLVGRNGRVTAIELDPQLAAGATANLSPLKNVSVLQGDATKLRVEAADAIYVSGAVSRIPTSWLDALTERGRLLLCLGPVASTKYPLGAKYDPPALAKLARTSGIFRIERSGDAFKAGWMCPAVFIPIEGAGDVESDTALNAAMESGNARKVTRLVREGTVSAEQVWLRNDGWSFAYG